MVTTDVLTGKAFNNLIHNVFGEKQIEVKYSISSGHLYPYSLVYKMTLQNTDTTAAYKIMFYLYLMLVMLGTL